MVNRNFRTTICHFLPHDLDPAALNAFNLWIFTHELHAANTFTDSLVT